MILKLQNQQTTVVKSGLAYHCHNNRRNLSDSRQLTNFLLNTIGDNKHEYLISLLCHLRATSMCESTIKVPHNSPHLCACFLINSCSLCFLINSCSLCLNFLNLLYNCSTIEQLVTSRFKLSITASTNRRDQAFTRQSLHRHQTGNNY